MASKTERTADREIFKPMHKEMNEMFDKYVKKAQEEDVPFRYFENAVATCFASFLHRTMSMYHKEGMSNKVIELMNIFQSAVNEAIKESQPKKPKSRIVLPR